MSRGPTIKICDRERLRAWVWIPSADVSPRWRVWRWLEQDGERACYRLRTPWLELHIGTGRYPDLYDGHGRLIPQRYGDHWTDPANPISPPIARPITPPSIDELNRLADESGVGEPFEVVWFPQGYRVRDYDGGEFWLGHDERSE